LILKISKLFTPVFRHKNDVLPETADEQFCQKGVLFYQQRLMIFIEHLQNFQWA